MYGKTLRCIYTKHKLVIFAKFFDTMKKSIIIHNFSSIKDIKILLLLTLFFISNLAFSQENGIISYSVSHSWIKKMATCEYISKAERERSAYVWGGREYVVNAELKFNENQYRFEYKENNEGATYQWRKEDYIIYRNRNNNEIFDIITLLNKQYVIQDSLVCQNWKIKNDMKEIAGHICMNASFYDTVKGKEIVAWFALDLPIPIGPDRYCGLPGIILEINEANDAIIYTATNVLLSNEKIEIEKPTIKKSRKIINSEEYNKKIIDYINQCKKLQRPYFWGISF